MNEYKILVEGLQNGTIALSDLAGDQRDTYMSLIDTLNPLLLDNSREWMESLLEKDPYSAAAVAFVCNAYDYFLVK